MARKEGFYWIRRKGSEEWEIGRWDICGGFYIAGEANSIWEDDVDELIEAQMCRPKTNRKHWDRLEVLWEEIIDMISDGKFYSEIAKEYGVPKTTVAEFVHAPERSARTRIALQESADQFAFMATNVLLELHKRKDATMPQANIAKELSQQYMKMAKFRDQQKYGDKIDVNANVEVKPKMSTDQLQTFIDTMVTKIALPKPVEDNGDYLEFDETTDEER